MHQLQRGAAPGCLASYRHGVSRWGEVTSADKAAIWRELQAMQGQRCAYCEADIGHVGRHIEHFRQRDRYPQGTFAWDNLFGSCNREDSCGKHKDRCGGYVPGDLIKPDVENPEHFFLFVSDGSIAVREGLNVRDKHRAEETLRILNLNPRSGLRWERKRAIEGHLQTKAALFEIAAEHGEDAAWVFIQEELLATAQLPFATAIKHLLSPFS